MFERLKLFFQKPTSQAKETSSKVEMPVKMESTSTRQESEKPVERKITSTWQERVAKIEAARSSSTSTDSVQSNSSLIKPAPDFRQLSAEERDAWAHEQRMRRLEESEHENQRLGLRVAYMHLSALSPTTRKIHAARHGRLFTAEQIRHFWSIEENRVGCKCYLSAVMVDKSGNPIVPGIIEIALAQYQNSKNKYGKDWI